MSLIAQSRSLYGSPLSKPKFASFVIVMLVVLVILSTSSIVNNIVAPSATKGGIPIFLMALAWSGFLSIVPIAILWFLDRREPESKWLYAIALLWGALIATGVAQPINVLIINAVQDYFTLHPDLQAVLGGGDCNDEHCSTVGRADCGGNHQRSRSAAVVFTPAIRV